MYSLPPSLASQTPLGAFLWWIPLPASVQPYSEPTQSLMNRLTRLSHFSRYTFWTVCLNYGQNDLILHVDIIERPAALVKWPQDCETSLCSRLYTYISLRLFLSQAAVLEHILLSLNVHDEHRCCVNFPAVVVVTKSRLFPRALLWGVEH